MVERITVNSDVWRIILIANVNANDSHVDYHITLEVVKDKKGDSYC